MAEDKILRHYVEDYYRIRLNNEYFDVKRRRWIKSYDNPLPSNEEWYVYDEQGVPHSYLGHVHKRVIAWLKDQIEVKHG